MPYFIEGAKPTEINSFDRSAKPNSDRRNYYSKEEIARAREMDLLTYLQNFEPAELVHVTGNTWTTATHDSLKISNGKWMWWSRGFGGASALDYLVKVRGDPSIFVPKPQQQRARRLLLPERAENNNGRRIMQLKKLFDFNIVQMEDIEIPGTAAGDLLLSPASGGDFEGPDLRGSVVPIGFGTTYTRGKKMISIRNVC